MKIKEFFSKKWVIASTATIVTLGVGFAVATPIALYIKEAGEKVVSDLGVTTDKTTTSSLQDGIFKSNIPASELTDAQKASGITKRGLNVVALGDSVTAGYTSLITDKTRRPGDNLSYADFLAKILKDKSRLGSYVNLARSGATASELMDTLTKRANYEALQKADLVVLTIGANDLLRGFNMLGLPFSTVSELLTGAAAESVSENRNALNITTPKAPLTSQLPTALPTILKIINNNPEVTFSVNKEAILNALRNASAEILRIISNIHKVAPKAEIVFNEYNFPFNRWIHNGKNITDTVDPMWSDLGFGTNTLRSTYNYVMGQIKSKVLDYYKTARWFSLQEAQDTIIADQVARNILPSVSEGVRLFQADLADIHPTEYAHALMGQKLYNDLIADAISETKVANDYPEIKARVQNAAAQPISDLFLFFLNNTGTGDRDNEYISQLILSAGTSPLFQNMLGAAFNMLNPVSLATVDSRNAATAALRMTTSAFINNFIFGQNTTFYDAFIANGVFYPYPGIVSAGTGYTSLFDTVQRMVAEAAIAHVDPTYVALAKDIFALNETDRAAFFTALGVTSTPTTESETLAAVKTYFESLTSLPATSPLASTVPGADKFATALAELNRALNYATKLADTFPGLLKAQAAQSKTLTWSNMRRDNKGVFAQIA